MPYIQPEIVQQAKQMDLLTYLRNYEPDELIHVSGGEYTTKTHDSLRISENGLWNWCSQGFGGKTALDYLIKVRGLEFIQAVEIILGRAAEMPPISLPKTEIKPKKILLPPATKNNAQAIQYLLSRGIDFEIIQYCIDTKKLYEGVFTSESGKIFHQCVFVGFDPQGEKRYANIRGIGTYFKGDATGSKKQYSFALKAKKPSNILHLFECPIDLLSYATLLKLHGRDWRCEHQVSLSGVYKPSEKAGKIKTPAALEQFLDDNPNIKKIVLRFDNDKTGREAVQTIKLALPEDYEIVNRPPPFGYDYNDYLCKYFGRQAKSRDFVR